MKKIIPFLLFITTFCFSASSQTSIRHKAVSTNDPTYHQKMITIQGCEDLNNQLTKLFGKDYTIANQKVMDQLEKNIVDKNASRCIRKKSLYGLYDAAYINKLYLIDDQQSQNSNPKQ